MTEPSAANRVAARSRRLGVESKGRTRATPAAGVVQVPRALGRRYSRATLRIILLHGSGPSRTGGLPRLRPDLRGRSGDRASLVLITVAETEGTVHDVSSKQRRLSTAFASYATEDRAKVLARI